MWALSPAVNLGKEGCEFEIVTQTVDGKERSLPARKLSFAKIEDDL